MTTYTMRSRRLCRALGLVAAVPLLGVAIGATAAVSPRPAPGDSTSRTTAVRPTSTIAFDSLAGRSGRLRARFLSLHASLGIPALARLFGDSGAPRPGVYTVHDSAEARSFAFIMLRPFADKHGGRIGEYRIGNWPFEKGRPRREADDTPQGFIEVTEANQDTYVSDHFRLRDFLTHDQADVWPKYLVLDERLIDKLELVIADLNSHGTHVEHLSVMSGFRTPAYNVQGVGKKGGRAMDSRHQYGDAADVFIDNTGSGRMNDLNHDKRINGRDIQIIIDAVDRVERAHPELMGGAGIYKATKAHGPFVHIDARGSRARWGRA